MVATRRENIKITEPGDLIYAHAILEARKAAGDELNIPLPEEPAPEDEETDS